MNLKERSKNLKAVIPAIVLAMKSNSMDSDGTPGR